MEYITKEAVEKSLKMWGDSALNEEHLKKYWNHWEDIDFLLDYKYQEDVLDNVFTEYKDNKKLNVIKFKCKLVDKFYSTNLKEALTDNSSEKTICNLIFEEKNFDDYLYSIDWDKNILAIKVGKNVCRHNHKKMEHEETKQVLSFISKYCSWHNPDVYPIYDKNVRRMLWCINNIEGFKFTDAFFISKITTSKDKDMLDLYNNYKEILDKFILFVKGKCSNKINKDILNYKNIDKFLWAWSKEIIRNNKNQIN